MLVSQIETKTMFQQQKVQQQLCFCSIQQKLHYCVPLWSDCERFCGQLDKDLQLEVDSETLYIFILLRAFKLRAHRTQLWPSEFKAMVSLKRTMQVMKNL